MYSTSLGMRYAVVTFEFRTIASCTAVRNSFLKLKFGHVAYSVYGIRMCLLKYPRPAIALASHNLCCANCYGKKLIPSVTVVMATSKMNNVFTLHIDDKNDDKRGLSAHFTPS